MSCPIATLAILVGLFLCNITGGSTEEVSAEKLALSYEKINAHLEKTVPKSDDPRVMMRELENMMDKEQSKCLRMGGKSLFKTLKLLVTMSQLPTNADHCDLFRQPNLFRKIDSGLTDDKRRLEPNYPLTKVDLLIEHYAFESARQCARSKNWPTMGQGLKQSAYDYIDQQLVKWLPGTSEIDPNMEVAENILRAQVNQQGAIADALRQFINLKWTPSSNSCNEEGFKTLLKNDLAVRGLSHLYAGDFTTRFKYMRRVERVIYRFITKHANQCGPIIRNNIFSALKSLDEDSYRKVLGLASTFYLSTSHFEAIVDSANEKAVDEQFTLPPVVGYAKELVKGYNSGGMIQLDAIDCMNEFKLRHYVKTMLAKEPESNFNGRDGKSKIEAQQRLVEEVLDKYLFGPCTNFRVKLDKLIEMDEYNYYADADYLKSLKSEFVPNLSYHMVRAANQACRYVDLNRQAIIDNFKSYTTKALANGVFFWLQK